MTLPRRTRIPPPAGLFVNRTASRGDDAAAPVPTASRAEGALRAACGKDDGETTTTFIPADTTEGYFTTAAAARYLAFRSTSAIRKAVMESRLRPVGRRGGVGPHLFTREELDRFARGDPPATLTADRPGAPPADGEAHGQDEVDETLEVLGGADAAARRLEEEGGRLPRESPGTGSDDGPHEGGEEGSARGGRSDRVHVASRGARPHRSRRAPSPAAEDALRRIQRVALRAEGDGEGNQKRSKS